MYAHKILTLHPTGHSIGVPFIQNAAGLDQIIANCWHGAHVVHSFINDRYDYIYNYWQTVDLIIYRSILNVLSALTVLPLVRGWSDFRGGSGGGTFRSLDERVSKFWQFDRTTRDQRTERYWNYNYNSYISWGAKIQWASECQIRHAKILRIVEARTVHTEAPAPMTCTSRLKSPSTLQRNL